MPDSIFPLLVFGFGITGASITHTHRSEIREPSYRAFFLSDRTYPFRQWTGIPNILFFGYEEALMSHQSQIYNKPENSLEKSLFTY